MSDRDAKLEDAALREAFMEDILSMDAAELRREAGEDGDDIGEIAARVRARLRESAASALRVRLATAKASTSRAAFSPSTTLHVSEIRRRIEALFSIKPSLGLAFRQGNRQSDDDWRSLYDDLLSMGEIKPDGDAI